MCRTLVSESRLGPGTRNEAGSGTRDQLTRWLCSFCETVSLVPVVFKLVSVCQIQILQHDAEWQNRFRGPTEGPGSPFHRVPRPLSHGVQRVPQVVGPGYGANYLRFEAPPPRHRVALWRVPGAGSSGDGWGCQSSAETSSDSSVASASGPSSGSSLVTMPTAS
jgi:hypothetical protein